MEALTFRNIRAGWTKAGLFPFNPEKVLSDIPQPQAESTAPIMNEVRIGYYSQVTSPKTPVTPVSVEAVASLHQLIKQDTHLLDEASKQRLQWRVQKLTSATQLSFTERALLQDHIQFLADINNEAKVRRATKSKIIGTARVMSYEDLEKARAERAAKDAKKEAANETKKAKQTGEAVGKGKRVRKGKSNGQTDAPESDTMRAQINQLQIEEYVIASEPWQAPVARMW